MEHEKESHRSAGIHVEHHSAAGLLWVAAWLFTIGFLQLGFWQGVLALVVWPYYLGSALSSWLPL